MRKKIVILDTVGGGRLANQLWNYMGLYAYSLEKGFSLENYAFFDYTKYFNTPLPTNWFIRFFFFDLNKYKAYRDLRLYDKFLNQFKKYIPKKIIEDDRVDPFYLPPTPTKDIEQLKLIRKIESLNNQVVYTSGWLFRNPVGIQKYKKEILDLFKPKDEVLDKVDSVIEPIKADFKHVFGVHIRQTDYKKWQGGRYYFSPEEARKIMDKFLDVYRINPREVAFVVCSDEEIESSVFEGLNVFMPRGNMAEDLFILSKTDLILGTDSTFGAFASYYGDIPFIVFERGLIDWEYYKTKGNYFENKKNTLVWY